MTGEPARRKVDDRIATAVRIPRDLHEQVVAAADDLDVSFSWLVTRLLRQWLDNPNRARGPLDLLKKDT